MQFLQFKLSARVEHDPWQLDKGWSLTKHEPHLTFFEIKVDSSILDQVIQWVYDHADQVLAITRQLELSHWHVFEKKRFNMAVLADSRFIQENSEHSIIVQRCSLLQSLFTQFGWVGEPEESATEDGLKLWLYKDAQDKVLFSCSLYNRPEVWYPHVSIAIKFQHRDLVAAWQSARAQLTGKLFHEVLSKQ